VRAGALVFRPRVRREHALGNPIQAVNHGSRENSGKHDDQEPDNVAANVDFKDVM
jgi:hypothetical protein